ncbi:MAG TPA: YbhB/YbcL family Raf kinase inhibitor-like protein [Gemmatimonadales bacterium]
MPLTITSSAFRHEGAIPSRYTCDGADRSPPLAWAGAPAGTKSFALIVDDPDAPDPKAPKMTYVHWVLYDIPASVTSLAEAVDVHRDAAGTREGMNDWKRTGYGGPCPPIGRHRYFHKLYALDTLIGDLGTPNAGDVADAMRGHVLGEAVLMGTYERTDAGRRA